MRKEIKRWFSADILQHALRELGLSRCECNCIHVGNNFIFRISANGGTRILRLAHELQKDEQGLIAEMEWLNYLQAHGIGVAEVIQTSDGRDFVSIPSENGQFWAVCYEEARCKKRPPSQWDRPFVTCWGRTAGQINALSKGYTPRRGLHRGLDWHFSLLAAKDYLPENESALHQMWEALKGRIESLRPATDAFGLIHGDLHPGNLLDDGDAVTVIDFDDCHYDLFLTEVANGIFTFFPIQLDTYEAAIRDKAISEKIRWFIDGYAQENSIIIDVDLLNELLKLRLFDLLIDSHRSFNFDELPPPRQTFCRNIKRLLLDRVDLLDGILK